MVLKAPNGQVFNLDALLNYTNNPGANFLNTVISSAGVATLSSNCSSIQLLIKLMHLAQPSLLPDFLWQVVRLDILLQLPTGVLCILPLMVTGQLQLMMPALLMLVTLHPGQLRLTIQLRVELVPHTLYMVSCSRPLYKCHCNESIYSRYTNSYCLCCSNSKYGVYNNRYRWYNRLL